MANTQPDIDVSELTGDDAELVLEKYFDIDVDTKPMEFEISDEDIQRIDAMTTVEKINDFWTTTDFGTL